MAEHLFNGFGKYTIPVFSSHWLGIQDQVFSGFIILKRHYHTVVGPVEIRDWIIEMCQNNVTFKRYAKSEVASIQVGIGFESANDVLLFKLAFSEIIESLSMDSLDCRQTDIDLERLREKARKLKIRQILLR